MNMHLIKLLVLKDWYLQRVPILVSLLGSAVAMAIAITGSKIAFLLGLIALVTVLIGFGANLAMATIVNERKEQTLPFIMSLPISYREYTAAKILANLIIFLVPWTVVTLGSIVLLLVSPTSPHGLIPYVAIMSTEMLVSTSLVAAVAIATESQLWTITAVMIGNLALNGFGYYVAHIPSIAQSMDSKTFQWSLAATGLLAVEFAAIVLLLSITFTWQARKKDSL
jgi:ABC-2 type transport system permease protein